MIRTIVLIVVYCGLLFLEKYCKLSKKIAGSSNGRTEAFEAFNPGSNPGPAAKVGSIEET